MKPAPYLIALCLGLAGCAGSPPAHYHTLGATAPAGPSGGARLLVEILPPAVPERVNRTEIVLTGSDGRLDVKDQERWAAPLSDEIRQAVADALWAELAAADVYQAPVTAASTPLPQYRLALRIERFDAVPGDKVRVEAAWTIRRLPQGASLTCRRRIERPLLGSTAEAAAESLGKATGTLAEAVAQSLSRHAAELPAPCGE